MKKIIVAMLMAGAVAQAWAAPYVLLKGSAEPIVGVSIRANSKGDIILTRENQQVMQFGKDQVERAVADKPADYDAAVRDLQGRKYDDAIDKLKKIMSEYRFLSWDIQAGALLGKAYLAKKDATSAITLYETLVRENPALDNEPEIAWGYRQALLEGKQFARLTPLLDKSIASGEPYEAARAQMLRGDLRAAEGNAEAAVLDYLRTVQFYRSQREIMPEATLKVAETLEKMRDKRAKEWYRKVAEEFPDSPEASKARAKS